MIAPDHRVPRRRRNPRTHCADCNVELTDENGYRRHDSTTFRSRCRRCYGLDRRNRHDRVEDQRRAEAGKTQSACEICGTEETVTRSGRVRRPTIDHDHLTGRIRGGLCSRCNTGIGLLLDNPALLRAAADYLDRTTLRKPIGPAA